jgi:hypothetical protein
LIFCFTLLNALLLRLPAESFDDFGSLSIGHNLTSNSRTLERDQWSLGTLYLGYGVTDELSVGVSPFLLLNYQMANFLLRHGLQISDRTRLGFDFSYFKTFGGRFEDVTYCPPGSDFDGNGCFIQKRHRSGFSMEATAVKVTLSHLVTESYRMNFTLSHFYYFNEEMPFSFRMDPANSDPYAVNLTSLHELRVSQHFFINLEAGFWGLNYQYPYYHAGLTLNLQSEYILFSVGASTTFSPSFPAERARRFAGYDSRSSLHPELQIQIFL